MVVKSPRKQKKCICNTKHLLKQITGKPDLLNQTELNNILLNLFTERNSDNTGHLILRGKDIYDRYQFRIQDSDIRAICSYIKRLPRRITKLNLCYNEITDVGFKKLVKKLLIKSRSGITNLNIMNNNLTEKSIVILAEYAKFIRLKHLRLNGNDLGPTSGEYLAKFLINNNSVEYLDIGQSSQTLTGVAHILAALTIDHGGNGNTTLKVLDFSRINPGFNRYNCETKWLAYHIEILLERNSNIVELRLQKNDFISHDMEFFARGLRRNTSLLYLDLGFNRVGDYGAELLAKYLAEGPRLVFLNLAGNEIHDTGARALSFGMPYSKLRGLDVSKNELRDKGVLDLLNTIKKPFVLRFLNIWGNKFGHTTCEVIQRMFASGVLFQHSIDVFIYEVDEVLFAAYYPNPSDRSKHSYYCELDFGYAQPITKIKRNDVSENKKVKVDYKKKYKIDMSNKC